MQYLRARYYKPENANFLTEDSYLGDILKPLTLNRYNYCAGNPVNYKDPSGNVILAVEFAKIGVAIGLVKGLCDAVKDAVEVGVDCYQNNKNFFEEYNWAAEGMYVLNSTVSGAVAGGTLGLTGNLELSMAAGEASYELLQGLTDVSTGAEDTKDLKNAKDVAGYVGKRVVKGAIRGAAEGALFDISLAAVNPVPISSALKMAFAGGYMVAKIGEGIGDKFTDETNAGKNMREKAKVYDPLSETDIAQRTGTTNQKIIDQSTGKNTGNNNLKEDVNVAQDAGKSDTCSLSKGSSNKNISFSQKDAQLKHIFRDAEGHFTEDTPANRQKILDVTSNIDNYLGTDARGNDWYAVTSNDGTQTWVRVRNGIIDNAGVNNVPREWDTEAGLYNNTRN